MNIKSHPFIDQLIGLQLKRVFLWLLIVIGTLSAHSQEYQVDTTKVFTSLDDALSKPDEVYILNLSHQEITFIPESIGDLIRLKVLYLNNNNLTSLPESIGELSNLHTLWLSSNKLTSLPESIGDLSKLYSLYLQYNQLTSLPKTIGNLKQLNTLVLYGNNLESIPKEIGGLTNLTGLNLGENNLTSIPKSIGELKNLRHMLYLQGNRLTKLPSSIKKLAKLEKLYVYDNLLSEGEVLKIREIMPESCEIKADTFIVQKTPIILCDYDSILNKQIEVLRKEFLNMKLNDSVDSLAKYVLLFEEHSISSQDSEGESIYTLCNKLGNDRKLSGAKIKEKYCENQSYWWTYQYYFMYGIFTQMYDNTYLVVRVGEGDNEFTTFKQSSYYFKKID